MTSLSIPFQRIQILEAIHRHSLISPRPVSSQIISSICGISLETTLRRLRELRVLGILSSHAGPSGGYKLVMSSQSVLSDLFLELPELRGPIFSFFLDSPMMSTRLIDILQKKPIHIVDPDEDRVVDSILSTSSNSNQDSILSLIKGDQK